MSTPPSPVRIGRYEVTRTLGQGGMGTVYLAHDPLLKRPVAIKVVRDRSGEGVERVLERFQREAEISARLSHPNIITVFDVGDDPAVGAFLAMEYVDGQSLASLIRERRPGPEAALFLLLQAMRGIQAAHDAGIIHRDVKPENMLVGHAGHLKLMDFGLARGDHARLTATGTVMGTPAFTAPELMLGGEPSRETDCYAFFVTAFELMTGELPYKGDSIGTTLYRIVHEPPTLPEDISPGLGNVFTWALGKAPESRPADLPTFMRELIGAAPLHEGIRHRLLDLLDLETLARILPSPQEPESGDLARTEAVSPAFGVDTPGRGIPPLPRPFIPKLPTPPKLSPELAAFRSPAPPPRPAIPAPKVRPRKPAPEEPEPEWDTPFAGVDWDAVLAPATPAAIQDLEAFLTQADVLAAEDHLEAEEALEDLQATLSGLGDQDVVAAENHAEAEEAFLDFAQDLSWIRPPA